MGANLGRAPGSRLQVITPSAVAAVCGTRFRVAADVEATREETLEGAVGLAAAGLEVRVGERVPAPCVWCAARRTNRCGCRVNSASCIVPC